MNDDACEACLRELARETAGDDPTRGWKDEILAGATSPPVRLMPPRPLLFVWAFAWVAIVLLAWSVPEESGGDSPAMAMPSLSTPILFAYQRQLLEQLDLP